MKTIKIILKTNVLKRTWYIQIRLQNYIVSFFITCEK